MIFFVISILSLFSDQATKVMLCHMMCSKDRCIFYERLDRKVNHLRVINCSDLDSLEIFERSMRKPDTESVPLD